MQTTNAIVSIHTVAIDAHIIKGRLEAEGIPAFITDDQLITADWTSSVAIGGVKVRVPMAHEAAAREILTQNASGQFHLNGLIDSENRYEGLLREEIISCPKCNSTETAAWDWPRKISLLILHLIHIPFPFSKHYHTCKRCSKIFRVPASRYPLLLRVLGVALLVLLSILLLISLSFTGGYFNSVHYLSGDETFIIPEQQDFLPLDAEGPLVDFPQEGESAL